MSVYKAIAAAAVSRGEVELPDGNVYTVSALSVSDMLLAESLRAENASDDVAVSSFAAIAARVTGAPLSVVSQLAPEHIGHLIAMARPGVELVAKALAREAAAEGNAPPVSSKGRRSTSPSKR